MKKYLIPVLIFSIISCCYAQENTSVKEKEHSEIHLDTGYNNKQYNLKGNDYHNPEINNDDNDEGMPFDVITSPLQLLKQYQNNNY